MNFMHRHFSKAAPRSQAWIDQNRAGGFGDQKYNQVAMFYARALSSGGLAAPPKKKFH